MLSTLYWLIGLLPVSVGVGFASIALNICIHFTLSPLWSRDLGSEFVQCKAFRPMQDKRMGVFAPFLSPFITAFCTAAALTLIPEVVTAQIAAHGFALACVRIGFAFWALFLVPVLTIEYWTYDVKWLLISYFLAATLLQRVLATALLAYAFGLGTA